MHGQIAQRCADGYGVFRFFRVVLAHGGAAIDVHLGVHLPLIGEEFQKIFLKTTIQIPVDTANVVTQLVFPVIREFYSLSIGANLVLTAKKTGKVRLQLQRQGL